MKLGLIGCPLDHSWSGDIHKFTIGEDYALWPIGLDQLADFLDKKDFDGINVTIPYKKKVMPYLDEIDETARAVGAVNTVINRKGRLYGYNTDYEGLIDMIRARRIPVAGKKAAILGSGGASRAAVYAVRKCGGEPVVVSRSKKDGTIDYDEFYGSYTDYDVLINATPVGMMPDCDRMPVKAKILDDFSAVIDIIANPLMTRLQFEAKKRGMIYSGGFEMLVRQAVCADRYFTGTALSEDVVYACLDAMYAKKRNIVLIGMPTAGKTTVARLLGERTGMSVIEMDDEIEKDMGLSIRQCFAEKGEAYFRSAEAACINRLRTQQHLIISCGGGVIKSDDNMRRLNENGIIVWLRRDLSLLYPSEERPLASNAADLHKLYEERRPLYEVYKDITVDNNGTLEETVDEIIRKIKGKDLL